MIERQEFRCALSGEPLLPDGASLDHKLPMSRGGEHSIANTQWIDAQINRMKGEMTNDEFIKMCRKVTEWTR